MPLSSAADPLSQLGTPVNAPSAAPTVGADPLASLGTPVATAAPATGGDPLDALGVPAEPAVTPAQPAPESTWQHIKDFATHPLVSAPAMAELIPGMPFVIAGAEKAKQYLEETGHPTAAKIPAAYAGVEEAEATMASGMTSPAMLGTVAATGGLGAMEGVAGPVVARLANLGFSAQGVYQAYKSYPEIKKALQDGDAEEAARLITANAANLGMAGMAGVHALG